jgi:oligopeptide/dipeptide ABC transporter ATP-binding protein
MESSSPLVSIENLQVDFQADGGAVRVVDGVSFELARGKTLGLVGESGCGKSVTALSLLRLLPGSARIAGGRIVLHEESASVDLAQLPEREMLKLRGSRIAMIFQEPMTSLNPVFTVGWQIAEGLLLHRQTSKAEARRQAIDLLAKVQIPDPQRRVDDYPHQYSGGMRQRAMIAMALACRPHLLIADEPTTALDVTTQAAILELLRQLQRELGMAMLFITHDLGVVAQAADEVAVMYCGQIVECGPAAAVLRHPLHPYTQALLAARPKPGGGKMRLAAIEGSVPGPRSWPGGCRFHPRCPLAEERCRVERPELREIEPGHWARCHLATAEPDRAPLASKGN